VFDTAWFFGQRVSPGGTTGHLCLKAARKIPTEMVRGSLLELAVAVLLILTLALYHKTGIELPGFVELILFKVILVSLAVTHASIIRSYLETELSHLGGDVLKWVVPVLYGAVILAYALGS